MEIEEFESYLTKDELVNFKRNLKELRGSSAKIDYDAYVKRMEGTGDVITSAFTWNDAPEGPDYWIDIAARLYERKLLINPVMKGQDYMQYFTASEWAALCKKAIAVHGHTTYASLMDRTYDTLGIFITKIVKKEAWRGVPKLYADVMSRKKDSSKITPGEFYQKPKPVKA